jgi:hypothetical protein
MPMIIPLLPVSIGRRSVTNRAAADRPGEPWRWTPSRWRSARLDEQARPRRPADGLISPARGRAETVMQETYRSETSYLLDTGPAGRHDCA